MLPKTDRDRELYEARLKARRDRNAQLKDAWEQGFLMGQIQSIQKSLNLPVTPREELDALLTEELASLAAELLKRMYASGE